MRTVEPQLSKIAQRIWPDAIVYTEDAGGRYVLERAGQEPVGLGKDFREARRSIDALRRVKEASS